jgi:ATP-dependent DNA helicase RecG
MNRTELTDLIHNRENSGVEFKRDDITPEKLAREMAALLNLEGGHILLGVEKDGTVSGLSREREKAEEWVMEVARVHLRPAAIPYWETIEWGDGEFVGIISLPADAPDKPYKAKRGKAWVTEIRVGTTTRDATDEEEVRLYQQSGRLQYDRKPVPGSVVNDLDRRRLLNYFRDVRRQSCPDETDEEGWSRLLVNTELMAEDRNRPIPSAGGLLLFGSRPNKYLPQSGLTAVVYPGIEKDYAAKERALIRGPAVALLSVGGEIVETGVIEQALEFVRRNTSVDARIDEGGRRQDRWDYPLEAVREAVVNAIAHRDYTITVTDIELSIYADRLEVISPGRLPNTVTVDKMRAGYRASRNELVKEVLRDYRYIEATGLGVPRKIVHGMLEHNGTEPDLIEEEDRFTVRLWKARKNG